MHIKIQFVDQFMGVPYGDSTTAQDIIEYVLSRCDIPLCYTRVCAILAVDSNKFGVPMEWTDLIKDNANKTMHFRILCLPSMVEIHTLDQNFLELLHNQINKLIINKTWPCEDEINIMSAALRCGIDFGEYNEAKHKPGFIRNCLKNFVPLSLQDRPKQLETAILARWKGITNAGDCRNHQTAVLKFLEFAQKCIKQFGCATINMIIRKVDGEVYNSHVYFGAKHEGIMITNLEGQIVLHTKYKDVELIYPEGDSITFYVKADKILECESKGIIPFRKVIDFVTKTTYPTPEEVKQSQQVSGGHETQAWEQVDQINDEEEKEVKVEADHEVKD